MLKCPVCATENDDLALTCRSCKSYLQAKVDTIDLFAALWGLMEAPHRTFKRIVLSAHKNYVVILGALQGIAALVAVARWQHLGRGVEVTLVLGLATVLGILAGIAVQFILGSFIVQVARSLGGRGTFRNTRAVIAYAGIPLTLWLLVMVPIEFGVFGKYLFEGNPSPAVIQPVLYYVLLTIEVLLAAWSLYLLAVGVGIAHGIPTARGVVVVGVVFLILAFALFLGREKQSDQG
jgi:hypothetical protein